MYNTKHNKKVNSIGGVQGDVPFRYIKALPENAKPRKSNIVAFGEVTGHHRRVCCSSNMALSNWSLALSSLVKTA
jgi:hypothetical protein